MMTNITGIFSLLKGNIVQIRYELSISLNYNLRITLSLEVLYGFRINR
jgi:hypothetical protein